jgi:hypothetical protein
MPACLWRLPLCSQLLLAPVQRPLHHRPRAMPMMLVRTAAAAAAPRPRSGARAPGQQRTLAALPRPVRVVMLRRMAPPCGQHRPADRWGWQQQQQMLAHASTTHSTCPAAL